MKLEQGQVWTTAEGSLVRIVRRTRLSVDYKFLADPAGGAGEHRTASKKAFCRLIRGGTLLTAEEAAALRAPERI